METDIFALDTTMKPLQFLCPTCQFDTTLTIAGICEVPNMTFTADVRPMCPYCNSRMYTYDTELMTDLKMLNSHNIITHSHCSVVHDGHTPDKLTSAGSEDPPKHYHGPFIYMSNVRADAYELLQSICCSTDTTCCEISLTTDSEAIPRHTITKLEVYITNPDPTFANVALMTLHTVVAKWIGAIEVRGITNEENHDMLKKCTIPDYKPYKTIKV